MSEVERPLSPHLQIYRPQLTSLLSIMHRATGVVLTLGALLWAWWLVGAAYGPEAFATVQAFLGSWFGRLLLLGFTFSLFYHLCNGVRHMLWDIGWGFDLPVLYRSGWIMLFCSIALTLLAFIAGYAMRGGS
ncbi:MAG TPA: succinate dehydrogenase, cytochrome b556 subunit [Alphaproteobacteria bacterium]|jgi:succinate dehydrogenase / fumarate reductase cytochrome b subunit|nr:succinate dehydrogenase, cytochrome b556 subunit [Alphaproteobacteria bacterium]